MKESMLIKIQDLIFILKDTKDNSFNDFVLSAFRVEPLLPVGHVGESVSLALWVNLCL